MQAIKYIHNYIYKGSNRTTLQVGGELDEVQRSLQDRYIRPTEAVWRLFEYSMHEEQPSVTHLAIHLLGEPIVYSANVTHEELLQLMHRTCSTLMADFQCNAENKDCRQYLHHEFSAHFTYNNQARRWCRRK